MKIIKGFVSYASLTNNASNTVSSLGELSDISQTYSLDKLVYSKSHDNNTDVATLTVMHSKDSVDSSYFELNYNQTEEIFKIVHFVKTFLRTYPSATFPQIIENLNTEYLGEVSGMQFGPIVIRGTDKLPNGFRGFQQGTLITIFECGYPIQLLKHNTTSSLLK